MNIIPKFELIDGIYYEGLAPESGETRVAKWNSKANVFEYVFHHWQGDIVDEMIYWDDLDQHLEAFQPLTSIEPRDFERVEELT